MAADEVNFTLQLLGSVRVRVGSRWVVFAPEKRFQLLAYLAYSRDWVSREKLAQLFWANTSTVHAQQNLRQLLHRTRFLDWLTGLEVTPQRLRWPVATDVHALQRALEREVPEHVLALYPRPLLEGLESDEAPEFSAWLEVEREHLHARWRDALLRRARVLQGQGEHGGASKLLEVLLAKNPLDEEALTAYLTAAGLAGQRERALTAYRNFSRMLHDEVGFEPTPNIQALVQAIQDRSDARTPVGSDPVSLATATAPASFRYPSTTFVGRESELANIAVLPFGPGCRLLTLVGPGGISKTRLALQAMR